MATISIPKERWGEVWKFLTSIGPITRISNEPIYEISPQHLKALCSSGLPFEPVNEKSLKGQVVDAENSQAI